MIPSMVRPGASCGLAVRTGRGHPTATASLGQDFPGQQKAEL